MPKSNSKMTETDRKALMEKTHLVKPAPQKQKNPTSVKAPIEDSSGTKKTYKCFSCGKEYSKRSGNFPISPHPMFYANDGHCHICRDCTNHYLHKYEDMLDNDGDAALKHVGTLLGYYVGDSAVEMSKRVSRGQNRLYTLARQANIGEAKGKNYDNYIVESRGSSINSIDEFNELKTSGEINITNVTIERWGVGFSPEDYKALDEHYKMLKRQNPNADNNQEIFIKDLCYIKIQQMDAMKGKTDKSVDAFDKLTKLYRDTFKQAGLKTVVEADTSAEESLGVTLALISQYTPEEYYKDKKLYKDFDGLGDYISRFLFRPLKNLLAGSNERDEEYSIKDDGDE
jgi:hypothetical protein